LLSSSALVRPGYARFKHLMLEIPAGPGFHRRPPRKLSFRRASPVSSGGRGASGSRSSRTRQPPCMPPLNTSNLQLLAMSTAHCYVLSLSLLLFDILRLLRSPSIRSPHLLNSVRAVCFLAVSHPLLCLPSQAESHLTHRASRWSHRRPPQIVWGQRPAPVIRPPASRHKTSPCRPPYRRQATTSLCPSVDDTNCKASIAECLLPLWVTCLLRHRILPLPNLPRGTRKRPINRPSRNSTPAARVLSLWGPG
jgi:hypothetical protein